MNKKKLCIPLLFTILFYTTFVCAQSDKDTDPNRWAKVKSWKGTFTFSSGPQDDVTITSDPQFITTSTARVTLDGNFVLDQKDTTVSDLYKWNGQGQVSGSIHVLLETKAIDGSSDCITETKDDQSLAPLENTPGYSLQWDNGGGDKGKYFFETGIFMIKDIVTQTCNGTTYPPLYQDWTIGGATTISWITLPASGYNITGDAVALFNGANNGHFHWDLEPAEFNPAPSTCAFKSAVHDTEKLNILRAMRDSIATTPAGLELIYIYYTNAPEILKIISTRFKLRDNFRKLIINNISHGQELIIAGETTITCETMQEVTSFLNELKANGSPKLNKHIEWMLKGIEDSSLLDSFGVRVQ